MARNNEKSLAEQKAAIAETLEKIDKCRKSHSKTLKIGPNGYLTIFPEEIRQLTWLTGLYVVCTGIKIIPDWIGELKNLKVLDISINQKIRKLPSSLVNLRHLKKLILDNTGLIKLPSIIGKLFYLELLDISCMV
jgi:Leucine-rich repeat (LRR) protein